MIQHSIFNCCNLYMNLISSSVSLPTAEDCGTDYLPWTETSEVGRR